MRSIHFILFFLTLHFINPIYFVSSVWAAAEDDEFEQETNLRPTENKDQAMGEMVGAWRPFFALGTILKRDYVKFKRYSPFLALLLIGAFIFLYRNRQKKMENFQKVLDSAMTRLAQALEHTLTSGVSGANTSAMEPQKNESITSGSEKRALSEGTLAQEYQMIQGLEERALLALLSDCYWGFYDAYAAFLWGGIPVEKRKQLLQKQAFLVKYAKTICELSPTNLGYHHSPYYLNSLPLNHMSNADLTTLVRKHHHLIVELSPMRMECLQLSAKEKIKMSMTNGHALGTEELQHLSAEFSKVKPSKERPFKQKMKIQFNSITEEEEVLSLEGLPLEMKAQLPSLGWMLELSDPQIEEILKPYSAQDIASIWVGPERTLEYLAKFIPAKKYELMISYRKKMVPSRDNKVFQKIHRDVLKALENKKEPVLASFGEISQPSSVSETSTLDESTSVASNNIRSSK